MGASKIGHVELREPLSCNALLDSVLLQMTRVRSLDVLVTKRSAIEGGSLLVSAFLPWLYNHFVLYTGILGGHHLSY